MKFSATLYAFLSFLALITTVGYAHGTRKQFYPTVIFLVTSKFCIAVLGNMCFITVYLVAKLGMKIFFGPLNDRELQSMYMQMTRNVVRLLLALTMFHEELSHKVVMMFTALFFVKVFHWLAQSRSDYIETMANVTLVNHIRILSLSLILLTTDVLFATIYTTSSFTNGKFEPSVRLLFAFEFACLALTVIRIICQYLIYLYDQRTGGNWNAKLSIKCAIDLFIEGLQFVLIMTFFAIVFVKYGIAFVLLEKVFHSFFKMREKYNTFRSYRLLSATMDGRFRDATPEELEERPLCMICRDDLVNTGAKRLDCGHHFHYTCLRQWISTENGTGCPTCRAEIIIDADQAEEARRARLAEQPDDQAEQEAAEDGDRDQVEPPRADVPEAPIRQDNAGAAPQANVPHPNGINLSAPGQPSQQYLQQQLDLLHLQMLEAQLASANSQQQQLPMPHVQSSPTYEQTQQQLLQEYQMLLLQQQQMQFQQGQAQPQAQAQAQEHIPQTVSHEQRASVQASAGARPEHTAIVGSSEDAMRAEMRARRLQSGVYSRRRARREAKVGK